MTDQEKPGDLMANQQRRVLLDRCRELKAQRDTARTQVTNFRHLLVKAETDRAKYIELLRRERQRRKGE